MIDYIKIYEEVLLEATKEQLRQQFKNIDEKIFNEIFEADPYNGKYAQWLLKIYELGNLPLEDLYKATEYLNIYHKVKNKLDPKYKNIHQTIAKKVEYVDDFDGQKKSKIEKTQLIKSLQELFQIIKPYKEQNADLSKNEKLKKDNLVYEDEKWEVYIPKTYEASCKLGSGTEWCTATGKTRNHYDFYSEKGKLFILINKINREKYQFHFEEGQYMDRNDKPISLSAFFRHNPELLFNFFAKKEWGLEFELSELIDRVLYLHPSFLPDLKEKSPSLFETFVRKFKYSFTLNQQYSQSRINAYYEIVEHLKNELPLFLGNKIFLKTGIYNAKDYIVFNLLVSLFDTSWLLYTKFLAESYGKLKSEDLPFIFSIKNGVFFLVQPDNIILTKNHTHFILISSDSDDNDINFKAIYINVENKEIIPIDNYENDENFVELLPYIQKNTV